MRILVCGGRDYNDRARVGKVLAGYVDTNTDCMTIIHGGARGADALAREWAFMYGCLEDEFTANWKRYGNAAGPIRNQQMLDEGKPDLVVAFPGGRGTADMVKRAQKAGVKVRIITE